MVADLIVAAALSFAPGVALDVPAQTQGSLSAQAASSGRPRECRPSARSKRVTVWQRVRFPALPAFCAALARAHALLESDPKGALAAVDVAEEAWPGRASAGAARGRALLALGKPTEALRSFEAARELDAAAVGDPKTMSDHARALVAEGKAAEAAAIYRVLVPRVQLLPSRLRVPTLLEAAFASMAAERVAPEGVAAELRLAEAVAFLAEARRETDSPLAPDVLLATALAHDRRGDSAKADSLVREAASAHAPSTSPAWVADRADAHALRALAHEATDPSTALDAWGEYLGVVSSGAFADAARVRVTALKKRVGAGHKQPKKKAPQ